MSAATPSPVFPKHLKGSPIETALVDLYARGLEQSEPYWNFGWPRLTEAFPTLRSGLGLIFSSENVGKSMVVANWGLQALRHNADAYWLEFSLDDSRDYRLGYILAAYGGIPIDLVHLAGHRDEATRAQRTAAFSGFTRDFGQRYRLFAPSQDTHEPALTDVDWITAQVAQARAELGPDAKLFVTVDSFHDVEVNERFTDEARQQKLKAKRFKESAAASDAFYLMTAHQNKHNRGRGANSDLMKGEGSLKFQALIVMALYCEVADKRALADIYHTHPDCENDKLPVLELTVLKNKTGSFRDVLFYEAFQSQCQIEEASPENQDYYRDCIFMAGEKAAEKARPTR